MSRVCIVTPDLAGPTRNGGVGTHCGQLAAFLARRGDAVTLVHTGPPDDADREAWRRSYRDEHGAVLLFLDELPDEPREPVALTSPQHTTAHRIYRWLRDQRFDVVHFQDWQGNGAVCLHARHTGRAFADTHLVVTAHGPSEWIREGMGEFPAGGRETLIADALERTSVELADLLVCPSRHLRGWLQAHRWALPARVEIAPYLCAGPEEPGRGALEAGALRELVFFGRLETRKGLLPFLDALEVLAADPAFPSVRVTFLGKHHTTSRGPSAGLLAEAARRHAGRFAVEVVADRDRAGALALLRERPGALVVAPSLADNLPFGVIECLVHGLPLLASNRGGIPELLPDSAHLVAPEAPALAGRLREIARNGLPPPQVAYSAREAARRWGEIASATPPPRSGGARRPTLSVVVAHFNQPQLLAATLAALEAQTLAPFEVIVADDGSTLPEAAPALAALETRYAPRGWRFLRGDHAGPAATRNRAASVAGGDALVFVDADNTPQPDMLAAFSEALARSGAEIVTCAFRAVLTPPAGDAPAHYLYCPLGPFQPLALVENSLGDTNCAIVRAVFLALGGFAAENLSATEDWQFLLGALHAGRSLAVVPDPLFDYRIAPASHARRHAEPVGVQAALEALPGMARAGVTALAMAARGAFARLPAIEHERNLAVGRAAALEDEVRSVHARLFEALQQREATTAELHQVSERLVEQENQVRSLAAANASLRGELEAIRAFAESQAHHIRRTARELAEGRQQTAWLEQRLATSERSLAELDDRLRLREEKIQRMQGSFSWRFTTPLRALRRQILDSPPAMPTAVPLKLPEMPPRDGNVPPGAKDPCFLSCLDEPTQWRGLPVRRFLVRGWVLRTDDAPVFAVRAVIGDAVFEGQAALFRPDVQNAFPDHPLAGTAGFEIKVRVPNAHGTIALEGRTAHETWQPFFEVEWTTAPDVIEAVEDPYAEWIRTNEDNSAAALRRMRDEAAAWEHRPLFSILLPVFNTPRPWLERVLQSVRDQTYDAWELCLADDASTEPHVRPLLEGAARADPRIKVVFREHNGHISAASNSALALATGEWVALLDHDDELAPRALFAFAELVRRHPDADLVYSDEDKIDPIGTRFSPYFKPDFLPDLVTAQNFVSHLAAYRTSIVRAVGGFREGYEGSQDWDLLLRFLDRTQPSRIRHVPEILYHWRAIPGSTALVGAEKNYSLEAARRVLADHFARHGTKVELSPVEGGHWRVKYPRPAPAPFVSLVVPTRNRLDLVRRCVRSILDRTAYPHFEILIVDNQSDDPATLAWLEQIDQSRAGHADPGRARVRVLRYPHPFNFSALNNHAVAAARGSLVGLLNNDLEVIGADWLDEMVSHAVRPQIGCVGAMLYYPHDVIQHAGVVLGVGGVAGHAFKMFPRGSEGVFNRARLVQNYSAVTAACLLVRKSVFEQVGGLDERDLAIAFNDVDFCLKVRAAGYHNLWTPHAELYHHESASRGAEDTPEKHDRFRREIEVMQQRWGALLLRDPAYNPNLTLEREDFSLPPLRPRASV